MALLVCMLFFIRIVKCYYGGLSDGPVLNLNIVYFHFGIGESLFMGWYECWVGVSRRRRSNQKIIREQR